MMIIAIIISILFVGMLTMIIKAYYDDIAELEHRVLVLERRDNEKLTKKDFDKRIEKFEKINKENKRDLSKNN